ncbi:cinnamyl alcohol dehydrogenase 6 [Artemisia annua]|uniref:Cinnamyl alcohol dehydrogenase 6 n=1 Tax=Artemisia annua TaxID=35608 RepID=A0A2U1K9A3_ARTAN|nr:cinnamyl alcohol dehydrogenase 6 [Artemisia annua]
MLHDQVDMYLKHGVTNEKPKACDQQDNIAFDGWAEHIPARKRVAKGSIIEGLKEIQEMMNLCGKHNITCETETVTPA